jgi:hypothetical protein
VAGVTAGAARVVVAAMARAVGRARVVAAVVVVGVVVWAFVVTLAAVVVHIVIRPVIVRPAVVVVGFLVLGLVVVLGDLRAGAARIVRVLGLVAGPFTSATVEVAVEVVAPTVSSEPPPRDAATAAPAPRASTVRASTMILLNGNTAFLLRDCLLTRG